MVASFIVHLAGEEMFRAFGGDVAICLVDFDSVLETLCNLLGQADLFFWNQLVGQAFGLGAFSPLLGL